MKSLLLLLILTLGPTLAFARPPDGATAKLDRVVATVDGRPIWRTEIDELFERGAVDKPTFDQTQQAIEVLIDGALIDNAATRLHVDVTDSEIAAAEQMIKQQNHIDDAALDKALADQHFTRAAYRKELARQIRLQRAFNADFAGAHVQVSDTEVAQRYAEAKKQKPDLGDFDKVKDAVREAIYSEKAAAAQGEWVKRLRTGAHVERHP